MWDKNDQEWLTGSATKELKENESLNIRNSKESFYLNALRMKFFLSPRLLQHDFHQYSHLKTTDTVEIVLYGETCWYFADPITGDFSMDITSREELLCTGLFF